VNNIKENSPRQKKRKIIESYNSSYHIYDKRYKKLQYEKLALILKDFTLESKIILDAGCGTGLLYEYLLEIKKEIIRHYFFSFVGVDISSKMIKKFKQKLLSLKSTISQNIHLIIADLENLPFRSHIFNSILSLTSYQNLPNVKKGLRESIRVAKNQASFSISILKKKLNKKEFLKIIQKNFNGIEIIGDKKKELEDLIIKGFLIK
jgi:ubiquinone/menaquinone biosynthesis C-methylase UbiE